MASGSRKRQAQVRTGKGGSPTPKQRQRIPRNTTRDAKGRIRKKS